MPRYREEEDLLEAIGEVDTGYEAEVDTATQEEAEYQQVGTSVREAQEAAKASLDFLAGIATPTVYKYAYPVVFLAIWDWLREYAHTERTFPQLALGLPRGFGKSTLIKIFILYVILFTDRKFILVSAATAKMAINIVADVIDMLEEDNIKAIFGDWSLGVTKDTQELKKFGFRGRDIIIAAVGAEGALRGLNLKNSRPDVMIFDDIQSKECADSEVQSTALEEWMIGTAMKAKSPTGCMFLFIGNMFPTPYSILRKLKHNPRWLKFITGGLRSDGTSLWEELQPAAQLIAEFENDLAMGKPEIFYAEVLNDENAKSNNLIDLNKLPELPMEDGDIPAGNFVVIDPATDKLGADAVSVGYHEVHDASPVLMDVTEGRLSPGDTIRVALKYCLANNCRAVFIEGNSYQYSLLYWCTFICSQLGIQGIEFIPIYSGRSSKNNRILNMLKSYASGEIYIHPNARLAAHAQITDFNALRTNNTDGILDLLTYSLRVVQEYGEAIQIQSVLEAQVSEAIEVEDYNTAF